MFLTYHEQRRQHELKKMVVSLAAAVSQARARGSDFWRNDPGLQELYLIVDGIKRVVEAEQPEDIERNVTQMLFRYQRGDQSYRFHVHGVRAPNPTYCRFPPIEETGE